MPEESDTNAPSGTQPERRRPTVISGLPPPPPKAEAPKEHKPTVVDWGVRPSHQADANPHVPSLPPPVFVRQPSAMIGKVRKGIETTVDTLARAFPGTPEDVLARAVQLLKETIPELLTDAMCVHWGEESQKRYGELTGNSLSLISSAPVQDGQRHLGRLYAILDTIRVSLEPHKPQGLFDFGKSSTPEECYERNEAELRQLQAFLMRVLPAIGDNANALALASNEFLRLELELNALSMAASYLADHVIEKSKSTMIQTLSSRSLSLTQTVVLIRQGELLRSQTVNTQRQLVVNIQEGVLNALPAWMETITVLFQKPSQTPTELYTLHERLSGVLQQLK